MADDWGNTGFSCADFFNGFDNTMTEFAETERISVSDPNRALRHSVYLLILTVYAGVVAGAILNVKPLLSANDRSRWSTVWSLADRGTYQIDQIDRVKKWSTIDKVFHEGHFYSSKPPLLPTLVAGLYWCVRTTTGLNLWENTAAVTRLILLVINLVPMLIALFLVVRVVERHVSCLWARFYIVVAGAFGTLLTPFLLAFNNHTIAATSLVFAIYPAIRILCDGKREWYYFALCGFWSAFVCCNELPAALFGVAVFVFVLRASARGTLRWFVPAALIPLGAFFLTNYLATGGWKPFYMYYGTEKYLYPGSYWANPKGIDRGGDSTIVYFLHCTIGHHGIFSLSPVYLFSLIAWFRPRDIGRCSLKPMVWLGAFLTVCILGFYLTRTENYNYGGNTSGLRWAFWLIPFWLLSMIPTLERWGDRPWFRIVAVVALLVSTCSAFIPMGNPWQQPWLFRIMEQAGWIHYG